MFGAEQRLSIGEFDVMEMSMKRMLFVIALFFFCTGYAAASGGDERGVQMISVTDCAGEVVVIEGYPERIVSLSPSITELLFAIGAGNLIVAVSDQSDYPEEALRIPTVGGFTTISIEKVVAANPDLVVATPSNGEEVLSRLRASGLTVLVINPETIDEIIETISLLGTVTGNDRAAHELNAELIRRIEKVTEQLASSTHAPTVAHIVWHDPIWVSGSGTFQDEVIRTAGGVNVFADMHEWQIVSLEEFVAAGPEFILVSSGTGMGKAGYDAIYSYITTEPRFQRLDAVKKNRVILVDADLISRGGPRIVLAIEDVANRIHPVAAESPDTGVSSAEPASGLMLMPLIAVVFLFALGLKRD